MWNMSCLDEEKFPGEGCIMDEHIRAFFSGLKVVAKQGQRERRRIDDYETVEKNQEITARERKT